LSQCEMQFKIIVCSGVECKTYFRWFGLRENLQETPEFHGKIREHPVSSPLNQYIDSWNHHAVFGFVSDERYKPALFWRNNSCQTKRCCGYLNFEMCPEKLRGAVGVFFMGTKKTMVIRCNKPHQLKSYMCMVNGNSRILNWRYVSTI
jgi:hypothetical protein